MAKIGFIRPFICRRFTSIIANNAKTSNQSKANISNSTLIHINEHHKWPIEELEQFMANCSVQAEFITEEEEKQLLAEIEPHMKRMRWEEEHWDQQIHLYREREHRGWIQVNQQIIDRIWTDSFPNPTRRSPFVHILDLHPDGFIRPHLDESRYCGNVISGLSLLSPSVMRLRHQKRLADFCWADLLLPRRSLYRISGIARFEFTHAILANSESFFRGEPVSKQRRISVICREYPENQTAKEEISTNVTQSTDIKNEG